MRSYVILLIVIIILLLFFYKDIMPWSNVSEDCNFLDTVVINSGKAGPTIGIIGSVHGNEPAGTRAIEALVADPTFKLESGRIIAIRRANPCGLAIGVRTHPGTGHDLNRQFSGDIGDIAARDKIAGQIAQICTKCDIIIDLHEGWGWYVRTRGAAVESVGSTIAPSKHAFWDKLAPQIVANLNAKILDASKQFAVRWEQGCRINSSLACFASRQGIPYVLVEITGQNDVQPIELRVDQNKTIIKTILQNWKMI